MSATALSVDFGPVTALPSIERGIAEDVVSVHLLGFGKAVARCSCGWLGHRRLLRASAMLDAYSHTVEDRCVASSPLFLRW